MFKSLKPYIIMFTGAFFFINLIFGGHYYFSQHFGASIWGTALASIWSLVWLAFIFWVYLTWFKSSKKIDDEGGGSGTGAL